MFARGQRARRGEAAHRGGFPSNTEFASAMPAPASIRLEGLALKASHRSWTSQSTFAGNRGQSSAEHAGAQTISMRPNTRFDLSPALCRCLPHRKHERVWPAPVNGDPEIFAE
jgi:hypothetical protein